MKHNIEKITFKCHRHLAIRQICYQLSCEILCLGFRGEAGICLQLWESFDC